MDPALVIDEAHRDVIEVSGDDALSYLQGQLSQDLGDLVPDQPVWSLVLEPTGKMGAWIRVTRLAPTPADGGPQLRLDVDAGAGPAVLARLERFRLRAQVDLELLEGAPLDPDAAEVGAGEAARIQAGVPRMGAEITDDVIPAELGAWLIDGAVSFTKGCYTGQELVARIDSRGGNVPRHLRGLVVDGDQVPEPGAQVLVDGTVVGSITSSAWSSALEAPVALSLVARKVEPPARAEVAGPDGTRRPAEIRTLPLT